MKKSLFDKMHGFYDFYMMVFNQYRRENVIDILCPERSEKILDIGGGTGYVSSKIQHLCKELHLIDMSINMLKVAKKKGIKNVEIASCYSMPFSNGTFDAIILTDVIHHLNNHSQLISEIKRVLKVGGKLIVYDFDFEKKMTKLISKWESLFFRDLQFVEKKTFLRYLSESGFNIKNELSKSNWFILLAEKTKGEYHG